MYKRNPIRDAVSAALTGGIAAALSGAPVTALAQDDDVLEQPRQFVTGSRILRTTTETATPITTISREQMDASGLVSVSEVLRRVSANTFGSFVERSGAVSPGVGDSAVDLRGLGANRTLVLLDGRRIANSSLADGRQANLNLLPFAAVERIEILRSGASAIYGSDAVAGVVNIILRKDFEGVKITLQAGRPTQDGGDEDQANLIGGISSSKGNITFGIDYSRKQMEKNADRAFSNVGLSSFGFPGSFFATTPDLSPMGPPGTTRFLATLPDPRCPSAANPFQTFAEAGDFLLSTPDSEFPNSVAVSTGPGLAARCRFNYAATSSSEARIRRQSVFVKADFDIGNDLTLFTRAIMTQNETFGRYAPTPAVGGSPFAPSMAANVPNAANPLLNNNPTEGLQVMFPDLDANGNTLTTSTTYTGPFELTSVFYRNVPGGFRDTTVDDTLLDLLIGVEGSLDLFGGAEWTVALQSSRSQAADTSCCNSSRSGLQGVIDDGSFDIFGENGPTDPAVAATFVVDAFQDVEVNYVGGDASINFDLGEMPSGPVSWAWGVEYEDSEFTRDFDAISNAMNIDGSAGGTDVRGARTRFSAYGEALIPLLSNLELDVAARYDDYNDFGSEVSPLVGVAYRPVDQLLIRGNWGEGYRAPDMDQLYGPQSQSFNGAQDTLGCESSDFNNNMIPDNLEESSLFPPGHPCVTTQYNNLTGGNPSLDAETSEQYGFGVVWSPTEDVTLGVDYYNIETDMQIGPVPLQTVFVREAAGDPFFENLVVRGPPIPLNPAGQVQNVLLTLQNLAGVQTDGVDVEASWNFGFDTLGDFGLGASFTHILSWDFAPLQGDPFARFIGQNEADTRGFVGLSWERGDFSGQLNWNHISTVSDAQGLMLSAWNTFDLQFGWNTPWQGKLSVGARNITNEDPPLDDGSNLSNPYYLNTFHDVYGRIPYVRYEQDL